MAAVQNSEVFFFPFHARLKTQPNIRPAPLGDVNGRWTGWRRSDYFYAEMIPEPDYSESEEEETTPSEDEDVEKSDDYLERNLSSEGDDDDDERLRGVEEENENEDEARKRIVPAPSDSKREKEISETDDSHSIKTFPGDFAQKIKSETAPRMRKSLSLDEGLIKPKKPSNPFLESSERKNLYKELKFKQKHGTSIKNQKSELQKALEKYSESRVKRELAASRRTSLEKILEQQALKLELQEQHGNEDTPAWMDRLQRQHVPRLVDPRTDEFFRVHARVVSHLMDTHESSTSSSILTESDS